MRFEPSPEKSQQAHALIERVFKSQVSEDHYTICYAYFMKRGLLGQKMYSYTVGFSTQDQSLVVIPMDCEGQEVGEAIRLQKGDVLSAKFDLQGNVRLKTTVTKDELAFALPGYVPTTMENAYALPISQHGEAEAFRAFIKENFKK